ncbi:zinc finger BED domain-containing protein RICESLEEPER 2-like [Senna tora]|uniref:Zinc finger BED domain-containing protein RICESLEEPER 2-like n=1 Tax=Senna tora TaxID=362788 RepID=A0A834TI19_9FABA|nr:zinc finger BED domain-containing protein RICESLEEPER 2-like [Senna tora]
MIAHVEEEKIYVLDTLQHDKHYYTTVKEFVNQDKCNISEKKVLGNKGKPIMFKDLRKERNSIITKSFVGVKDDYLAESNDFVSYLKKLVAANNVQEYIKNNHFDELDTQNAEERNYYKDAAKEFKLTTIVIKINAAYREKKFLVLGNKVKPIMFKDLRKVWESFKDYDQSNTILIGDFAYKPYLNPIIHMDMGSSIPPKRGAETESATVQNSPTVSNLPKKRSATSEVWNYFVSLGVGEDGKPRAKCKACDEVYVAGGSTHGTSSLSRHLPKCPKRNNNVGNMLIDHAGKLRSRKISQKVLRSLTAMAIIKHDLPFSFVEYEGVREIFKYCNPDVKFITRNTAVADVWKVYVSRKESLKQELDKIPSRICLTSDVWTACTTEGYICLTAHYVDSNFTLTKSLPFVICLHLTQDMNCPRKSNHKGYMAVRMKEKFDKYWSEYSVVLALGAILDPQLKFPLLECCFNRVDPTTCQSKLDVVRKKLFELFNAYAKNSSSSSSSSQCQIEPPNISSNSETGKGLSSFTALMDIDSQIVSQLGKSQLEQYLEEAKLEFKFNKDLDVLKYWKNYSGRFPDLSLMAFDILSIPITTEASESTFSIGSRVLNKYRSCLLPEKKFRLFLLPFQVSDIVCAKMTGLDFSVGDLTNGRRYHRHGVDRDMAKQGKDYREEVRQALAVTRTMLELTDANLEAVNDEVVFSRGCLGGGEEDSSGKIAQKHDKDLTKRRQYPRIVVQNFPNVLGDAYSLLLVQQHD